MILDTINSMKSSKVSNYIIAGLDSYMLTNGCVRLFENSRNHQDQITPHSHRFAFSCLVLQGSVVNRVWSECPDVNGDFFEESELEYCGKIGSHIKKRIGRGYYNYRDETFHKDRWYHMGHEDIHSIIFSKGAVVLFFEGPQVSDKSMIIEPVVNGVVIPTYETKDYMFQATTTESE